MHLAFCLFHYFPFGGRERNCEATARLCAQNGHEVDVFTRTWEGEKPQGLRIHQLGQRGLTNIGRDISFVRRLHKKLARDSFDVVIGFDLIPGVDIYYAADPCMVVDVRERSWLSRKTRRSRRKLKWERMLLSKRGAKRVLVLTEARREEYLSCYEVSKERIEVLPANLEDAPLRKRQEGAAYLADYGITDTHLVLLFVGSDFRRKGLDRVIAAMPQWPGQVRLVVVGEGDFQPFLQQAKELSVEHRILFAGPRDDVSVFHARADLLVHPARKETAGVVLLEAMRHGVPVITTEVCGFAPHVKQAQAGFVLTSPFQADELERKVAFLLDSKIKRRTAGEKGREYVRRPDLYGRHDRIRECIEALDPRSEQAG